MTSELEAELNRIGWARVDPWRRVWLATSFKPDGGLVAPSSRAAKDLAAKHRSLCLSIVAAVEGLTALSDETRTSINLDSTAPDQRDGGRPDHVGLAVEALHAICPGLLRWAEYLEHEAGKAKLGRPRKEPAFRIAAALAEVHLIGKGKVPKIGRLADGSGPSGVYGKTVANVCMLLGINVADVVPHCKRAINDLTPDRIAAIRTATNSPSLSLFAANGKTRPLTRLFSI